MKKIILTILIFFSLNTDSLAAKQSANFKHFGHLPMIDKPVVSPDGKSVAAIFNSPDGPQVVLSAFGSNDIQTIVKLNKSKDRLESITWANNERLLVSASYSKKWQDYRYRVNKLYAVNSDGSDLKELRTRKSKSWSAEMDGLRSAQVRSLLKDDKEHVIIQTYDANDQSQAVYKVNIYDSDFDKLFVNKYDVYSWITNEKGIVVLGVGNDDDDPDLTNIWYRKNEDAKWTLLHSLKAFESDTFSVAAVSGSKAYVLSDRETGRESLWLFDIPSGKFEKMVYGHDKFDVNNVIMNKDKTEVVGVMYFDHFHVNHYFDGSENKLQRTVKASFKGYETAIYSMDRKRKKIIVRAMKNNSPDKFFWLDLEKKAGGIWFSQFPYIERNKLASSEPFEFTTKDGMLLNGYITQPANYNGKPLPLIIYPHGGPIGIRDYQYFNPYVQYMANMGYTVLQVNYRGSGGFGNEYLKAGYKQWGRKMQTDIYEAIDWVEENKLADTSNSCLVGHSYGGYVALTAAFQRPKQFKCIVSIAGVSDLYARAQRLNKVKSARSFIKKTMADHKTDEGKALLKEYSAINHLSEIKAPILLVHGKQDTQVYYKQSKKFYEEAKESGIDVDYIEFEQGTHYLDENDNRLETFESLGKFLTEHLN